MMSSTRQVLIFFINFEDTRKYSNSSKYEERLKLSSEQKYIE